MCHKTREQELSSKLGVGSVFKTRVRSRTQNSAGGGVVKTRGRCRFQNSGTEAFSKYGTGPKVFSKLGGSCCLQDLGEGASSKLESDVGEVIDIMF